MGMLNGGGFSLPQPLKRTAAKPSAARILTKGDPGGPVLKPVQLLPESTQIDDSAGRPVSELSVPTGDATSTDVGTAGLPFTTARVQLKATAITSSAYPYRATGKLAFSYYGQNAWCTASLIGKGLLVTAAHCVTDYGSGGFLPNAAWSFIPGLYNGKAAYGKYAARAVYALSSYVYGTDECASAGVVCESDMAVIVLKPDRYGKYAGTKTGWLSYGYNGWGFTSDGLTQITQLGYPIGIDNGAQMIRNDSQGLETDLSSSFNTVIGSLMNGGSSGGPWVNNLGIQPVFNGVYTGYYPAPNVVVGVTSWGIFGGGPTAVAVMGASPFTSDNIQSLVTAACTSYPAAC